MKIDSKNPKNKSKEELMIEDLVEDFKILKEILDKYNIKYWLECGTLLGAVREGRIIPWDDDIEFGIMDSEVEKLNSALPEISEKGFKVRKAPLPILKYAFKRSEYGIDAWVFSESDENNFAASLYQMSLNNLSAQFLWYIWLPFICAEKDIDIKMPPYRLKYMPHSKFKKIFILALKYFLTLFPYKSRKLFAESALKKLIKNKKVEIIKSVVPKHYLKEFKEIKFYGLMVNIPLNDEEYVAYKYGKDWRTPRKKWSCYDEDGSITIDETDKMLGVLKN